MIPNMERKMNEVDILDDLLHQARGSGFIDDVVWADIRPAIADLRAGLGDLPRYSAIEELRMFCLQIAMGTEKFSKLVKKVDKNDMEEREVHEWIIEEAECYVDYVRNGLEKTKPTEDDRSAYQLGYKAGQEDVNEVLDNNIPR